MNGTSPSQTLAIDLIPPRITKAVSTAITMPVSHGVMRNVSFTIEEMEFACTIFPMPNAETAVRMAKMTPSHFCFMPRSSTYIGPPAIRPLSVLMRYFTESSASEYLVAMPNTPVSHIHSTAPGPPGGDSRRDADDVAGADGGGQRNRQCPELTDVTASFGRLLNGEFDRLPEISLDEAKAEREKNVGAQEENQQWRAPEEIAELADEFFKFLHVVSLQKTRQ